MTVGSRKTLLAVASGGGHWDEMMLLADSFGSLNTVYACTTTDFIAPGRKATLLIRDCNRHKPLATLGGVFDAARLVWAVRPDVVITTGAAPGLLALLFAKVVGAHTIWLESVANADELSLSGRIASRFVDLCLTQWDHLADGIRVKYLGRLL